MKTRKYSNFCIKIKKFNNKLSYQEWMLFRYLFRLFREKLITMSVILLFLWVIKLNGGILLLELLKMLLIKQFIISKLNVENLLKKNWKFNYLLYILYIYIYFIAFFLFFTYNIIYYWIFTLFFFYRLIKKLIRRIFLITNLMQFLNSWIG